MATAETAQPQGFIPQIDISGLYSTRLSAFSTGLKA